MNGTIVGDSAPHRSETKIPVLRDWSTSHGHTTGFSAGPLVWLYEFHCSRLLAYQVIAFSSCSTTIFATGRHSCGSTFKIPVRCEGFRVGGTPRLRRKAQ